MVRREEATSTQMNIGEFFRSPSAIVMLETILVAGLMFGTFSVLVRVTNMETVGLWVLINALLGFSRAIDFWSRGLASFVGEARGNGKTADAASFVTTAVMSGVGGYAVLAVLGAGVIWLFAEPLSGEHHAALVREIVPLMALTFWLLAIAGTYGGAFIAYGKPLLKASQTVGGAIIFFILAILLAPGYGLWGILISQALQSGLMLVYSAFAFHGFLVRGSEARWRMSQFRQLASFGGKAILVGMLQLSIEPLIRILASQFGGLGAVATVELASRPISVVRGVMTALGQVLVPEFARLGAAARLELAALYHDVSRMFLMTSISAFSLLASAAPALEEVVLGRTGTGFVGFAWLLSIGWFANTITAPAYFLLLSRRRLRPLFWSHLIMTTGAAALGIVGGLVAGVNGAISGAASALVAASLYLAVMTDEDRKGLSAIVRCLWAEPSRLMPVLAAVVSVMALEFTSLPEGDAFFRFAGYGAAITITGIACLLFGDVRSLVQTLAKIG